MDRLSASYSDKQFKGVSDFDFISQTIAAILQDERSICLRDMPAFYACAASMLYKLKEMHSLDG